VRRVQKIKQTSGVLTSSRGLRHQNQLLRVKCRQLGGWLVVLWERWTMHAGGGRGISPYKKLPF